MEINWELVDQFERERGDQIAIARAGEFYFAYFSLVWTALPPMACQAFEIAKKCRQGTATSDLRCCQRLSALDALAAPLASECIGCFASRNRNSNGG